MCQNALKFRLGLDTPTCAVFWLASFLETTSYTSNTPTPSSRFSSLCYHLSIFVRRVTTPRHRNSTGGRGWSGVTGKGVGKSNSVDSHRCFIFSSCFSEFSTGARGKHSRNRRSREGCSSRPPTDPLHRDLILIGRKKRRQKRAHLLRLSVARRNRRCDSTESLWGSVCSSERSDAGEELRRRQEESDCIIAFSGRVTLFHHLCDSLLLFFHPCCIILDKTPLMVALVDAATVCHRRPPPAGDHYHPSCLFRHFCILDIAGSCYQRLFCVKLLGWFEKLKIYV